MYIYILFPGISLYHISMIYIYPYFTHLFIPKFKSRAYFSLSIHFFLNTKAPPWEAGPFTSQVRGECEELWRKELNELEMPHTKGTWRNGFGKSILVKMGCKFFFLGSGWGSRWSTGIGLRCEFRMWKWCVGHVISRFCIVIYHYVFMKWLSYTVLQRCM